MYKCWEAVLARPAWHSLEADNNQPDKTLPQGHFNPPLCQYQLHVSSIASNEVFHPSLPLCCDQLGASFRVRPHCWTDVRELHVAPSLPYHAWLNPPPLQVKALSVASSNLLGTPWLDAFDCGWRYHPFVSDCLIYSRCRLSHRLCKAHSFMNEPSPFANYHAIPSSSTYVTDL